jgi:hypothetical protein
MIKRRLQLQSPSGLRLRLRGCHIPCSSPTLRSGSSCVLHPASFIRSSYVSLHHARSPAIAAKPCPAPTHNSIHRWEQRLFRKQKTLLGLVPLHSFVTTSFRQGSVHPLPSVVVLAGRPLPAFRGSVGTHPRSYHCLNPTRFLKNKLAPRIKSSSVNKSGMPLYAPPLCAHRCLTSAFLCAPGHGCGRWFRSFVSPFPFWLAAPKPLRGVEISFHRQASWMKLYTHTKKSGREYISAYSKRLKIKTTTPCTWWRDNWKLG